MVHDIPPGNVSTFSYFVPPTLLTRANFPSNPSPLINSSGGKGELTGGYDPFSTEIPSSIPMYTRFESRTPWNSRVTFDGNFVFTRKIRYSPIESYNVTVSIKRKDRVTWRLTAIMDRIFSPIISSPPLLSLFFFHSIPFLDGRKDRFPTFGSNRFPSSADISFPSGGNKRFFNERRRLPAGSRILSFL